MENDNFNSDERNYSSDPFNNTTSSDVIDSRSFARLANDEDHSEQDWTRGTQYQSESYKRDSWNRSYVSEDNEANPRRLLLALIASIGTFVLWAVLSLIIYDINYLSFRNFIAAILPPICMIETFYKKNLRINKLEMFLLFVLNCILLYLMFYAIMARGIQKSFPEMKLSFLECCIYVSTLRYIQSTYKLYYTHLFWILGCNLFLCILVFVCNIITLKNQRKKR